MYSYLCELVVSHIIQLVVIFATFFCSNDPIVPDLPVGAHSSWPLCPFDKSSMFFKHFFASCHSKMSGYTLHFPCPGSGIARFSQQPSLLSVENGIWKPRSQSWRAHCCWASLLPAPPNGQNSGIFVSMCIYLYRHTHLW